MVRCDGFASKAAGTMSITTLLAQDYNVAGISLLNHLLRILLLSVLFWKIDCLIHFIIFQ